VVSVAPAARKKALGEVFQLEELQLRTTTGEGGGGADTCALWGSGAHRRCWHAPPPPLHYAPAGQACLHRLPAFDAPAPPAPAECPYLEEGGEGPEGLGRLRHAALVLSTDAASGRSVYALLMPVAQRALVVVVQPGGGGQREVTPAVLDRCWREALQMQQQAAAAAGGAAQVRPCVPRPRPCPCPARPPPSSPATAACPLLQLPLPPAC
jgi:hypothetical protein